MPWTAQQFLAGVACVIVYFIGLTIGYIVLSHRLANRRRPNGHGGPVFLYRGELYCGANLDGIKKPDSPGVIPSRSRPEIPTAIAARDNGT